MHAVRILWHLLMGASARQSRQSPGCTSACRTAGCAQQPLLCEARSCVLNTVLTPRLMVAQAPLPQEVIKRVTKGACLAADPASPPAAAASVLQPGNKQHMLVDTTLVRCVCAAHEVVEVDGFVFKRKRSTAAAAPPAQPAAAAASDPSVQPLAPTPPPAAVGAAPALAGSPAAMGPLAGANAAQPQREADPRVVRAEPSAVAAEAAAAALEALPADGVPETQRLLALCEVLAQVRRSAAVCSVAGSAQLVQP